MWIFTVYGFFSAVCLNNRPMDGSPLKGKLTVDIESIAIRARVRSHLEALIAGVPVLEGFEILDTPGRDYACRIVVPSWRWKDACAMLAQQIDYHNFKDRVHQDKDSVYSRWLSHVWGVGNDVQSKGAK